MMRRALLLLLLCVTVPLIAADPDLPLGIVEQVAGDRATVRMLAAHILEPDDVVEMFGPGTVEKHPLSKQVVKEQRRLTAKAQVLAVAGDALTVRIFWTREGGAVAIGDDVLPVPGEASPDAPPVLGGKVLAVTVPAQGLAVVDVPVVDPEGGPLAVAWSLSDATPYPGALAATGTGLPRMAWVAPALAGKTSILLRARDAAGQAGDPVTVDVTVTDWAEGWRSRSLHPWARFGVGGDPQLTRLVRDDAGAWWGVTADRTIVTIAPGWLQQSQQVFKDFQVSRPVALAATAEELFILDGSEVAVLVVGRDGVLRRKIGGLGVPTDLVRGEDGTLYVADQYQGGVQVFSADGAYRCRLGRAGTGTDAFAGLQRVALGPDATCYALDVEQKSVQRFDRHHRRQATWQLQLGEDITPVDCAWHARGLMVLLDSGAISILDDTGRTVAALPSLTERGWYGRLYAPTDLTVDRHGWIYVTFGTSGIVAAYTPDGTPYGARGPNLWAHEAYAVDGRGRICGLDRDTATLAVFDSAGWQVARFGGWTGDRGPFDDPGAMALSPEGRWLCVIDTDRVCVVRYDRQRPADRPLIIGTEGRNNGQFQEPVDVTVDAEGRIYVLDADLHRVAVFDATGAFIGNIGNYDEGLKPEELIRPICLTTSTDGNVLYIFDGKRYAVMKFSFDHATGMARHIANSGGYGDQPGQFYWVTRMGCDRAGLLYALDTSQEALQVLDFRANSAVSLVHLPVAKAGCADATSLGVLPDGMPWLGNGTTVTGLRWE